MLFAKRHSENEIQPVVRTDEISNILELQKSLVSKFDHGTGNFFSKTRLNNSSATFLFGKVRSISIKSRELMFQEQIMIFETTVDQNSISKISLVKFQSTLIDH